MRNVLHTSAYLTHTSAYDHQLMIEATTYWIHFQWDDIKCLKYTQYKARFQLSRAWFQNLRSFHNLIALFVT